MRSIRATSILLTLSFFLIACSGGESSKNNNTNTIDALKINAVYTDILHQHQSFFEKWDYTPNTGIQFTVSVQVSLPNGPDNLSELYFRNKLTGWYWPLLGGPDKITKDKCYISSMDIYECRFYSTISLNRVNLKNWEVVAENKQGDVICKDVEFLLPGGNPVDAEQFVYSSRYSGSTVNGIAALEAMTIAGNEIEFSSNPGSQSFHIEFETMDSRAKHYGFYFYDGTGSINNIGEIRSNAPSITSMPIVQGHKTVVDIPWSEIRMFGNSSIADINGLHIILYDEPISWIEGGVWFNYISLSEFLTLSP